MENKRTHALGLVALFAAAICWGTSYAFTKTNLDVFSPQWLLVFRFWIAAILLAVIGCRKWKKVTPLQLRHGIIMGCLLYGVFFFYTTGLQFTAASRSSFIVGSYVILVPFAYWIIRKTAPRKRDFVASVFCLAGIALILLGSGSGGLNRGDLITAVCTVFYATHVVFSAKYARDADVLLLNMIQFVTTAVIALVVALISGPPPAHLVPSDMVGPLYLAVIGSVLPYVFSLFGQKHVRTTTSAIILSFESVFGCLCAVLVLHETISLKFVLGACIVVFSFFISENIIDGIRKIHREHKEQKGTERTEETGK